jgi:3-O-methylgallate 3,4-dioxygenase
MAELVAACATSHSVLLAAPPSMWAERAQQDRSNRELYDGDGVLRTYDELVARVGDRYLADISIDVWEARWSACQDAIARLASDLQRTEPDVVIIIGDDQRELYTAANQPAIAVSTAASFEMALLEHQLSAPPTPFFQVVAHEYLMDDSHKVVGAPEFATELVGALVRAGFDIATSGETPAGAGFGHAFGFPVFRFFGDRPISVVPVLLNTYYPPNQPTPARCFEFGAALRAAVEGAESPVRVAIIASGGLSHFVIDEALDRRVLDAIHHGEWEQLRRIPTELLNSGSSEIRNWIAAAGALQDRPVAWSEYVPCYRSEAGTGCAMGFLSWTAAP